MKRNILLPVILVLLFSFSAFANHILILTNPRSNETNVFRPGSYIVFELKADNTMHEGFIRDITDSSIVLDYSQVSLSQINILAGSTKARLVAGRVANAVGNSLLYTGITVVNCGTSLVFENDYYYWPIGGTVWLAGAVVAGLGYAFDWALSSPEHAVRVRNYKQWKAAIITEGTQPVTEKQNVQASDSTQTVPANPHHKKKKRAKFSGDDVYGN